jgi:osmotically-inducible protein OsmY
MPRLFLYILLLPMLLGQISACGTLAASGAGGENSEFGFNDTAGTPSDASISSDIRRQLIDDPDINASNISVRTKQGVVTLEGQVASHDIRQRVIVVCNRTPGVKQVDNRLRIDQD